MPAASKRRAKHAVVRAVLALALPGNDEVAIARHGHRRAELVARGVVVDPELGRLGDAGGIEAPGEDAIAEPSWLGLYQANDEVAVARACHGRVVLVARGIDVDLELGSLGDAGPVEAPGEDAKVGAVLVLALPGNDEVAVARHGHGRVVLVARAVDVDLELVCLGDAGGVEAAGEDAVGPVLVRPVPGDDEGAVARHAHGSALLAA
jgi:hypothetical protein